MSLLLDALKKSGAAESKISDRLEKPLDSAYSAQTESSGTARTAGENLFAAKKTPVKKHWRLGIIPSALIAGGILAVGGGFYVYLEITPPTQRFYHHASPATAPRPAPTPIATAPALATMPTPLAPGSELSLPATKQLSAAPPIKKTPPHGNSKARAPAKPLNVTHTQEPDSIDLILIGAYQAYQNGDYATAWQRYRMAYTQDPKNRDALLGLAVIAQRQKQDDTALHYYRQVLQLNPRDPVARAALLTFGGNDPASKESSLKQLISQQPDSAVLYFALGNQYAGQLRWPDAQQAYFNALAIEPANALFAFSLATSLDHLGQHKAALNYYRQALQFDTTGHAGFDREQAQRRLDELNTAGK
jgi:tetratricopeptide (TPR) repeat protein